MTGIFTGLGAITVGVFGGTVTVTPPGGVSRAVQAIFRETPTTVDLPDGGQTITVLVTLRAPKSVIADLVGGGLVTPENGNSYLCGAQMGTANPSTDSHMVIQLEKI